MPLSKYQAKNRLDKKKRALELYKRGLTTREIAPLVNKSYTWVWSAVKELSTTELDKGKTKEHTKVKR